MTKVGVRRLKNELSLYLEKVKRGEVLCVTLRGKEIAILSPVPSAAVPAGLTEMVAEGLAAWKGGKPKGASHPIRVRGAEVSHFVIEDRR